MTHTLTHEWKSNSFDLSTVLSHLLFFFSIAHFFSLWIFMSWIIYHVMTTNLFDSKMIRNKLIWFVRPSLSLHLSPVFFFLSLHIPIYFFSVYLYIAHSTQHSIIWPSMAAGILCKWNCMGILSVFATSSDLIYQFRISIECTQFLHVYFYFVHTYSVCVCVCSCVQCTTLNASTRIYLSAFNDIRNRNYHLLCVYRKQNERRRRKKKTKSLSMQ